MKEVTNVKKIKKISIIMLLLIGLAVSREPRGGGGNLPPVENDDIVIEN